ncbi:MAG: pilus assembly protein [Hyphomicrobiales bacterium]|nr:pilus assembly protein [Hyphomicrobiales bacterium]
MPADTAGAALVELTLFMPMLALMAVAVMNFGLYFWYKLQVENAAQAGAQWAINNAVNSGYSSTTISGAATNANNTSNPSFFSAISVATSRSCACPSSAGLSNVSSWSTSCATGSTCSDGSSPGTYIIISASGTFTPLANYASFFSSSYTVSSTATVRVQ